MAGKLILIVEDDENSRMLLRDVLQLNEYRTVEAHTAEAGVALAQQQLPALILMDINLPGMNGIEALRQLRREQATAGIPVVAVTASVMNDQQQEAMTAGFDAFERKPISVLGLLQTVRKLLAR